VDRAFDWIGTAWNVKTVFFGFLGCHTAFHTAFHTALLRPIFGKQEALYHIPMLSTVIIPEIPQTK